jgi:hypothetical protein
MIVVGLASWRDHRQEYGSLGVTDYQHQRMFLSARRFAKAWRLIYFALMDPGEPSSTGAPPVEGRSRAPEGSFWKA